MNLLYGQLINLSIFKLPIYSKALLLLPRKFSLLTLNEPNGIQITNAFGSIILSAKLLYYVDKIYGMIQAL